MDNKSYRFKVGTFDCVAISDVTNRLGSARFIYSKVPDEYLLPTLKAHNLSPDKTPMEWSCLFINTGEYNLLVDTGSGPGYEANTGLLFQRLETLGVEPANIDMVILSHADFDHIGGVIDAEESLAFPNAQFILSRDEWAFWTSDPDLHRRGYDGETSKFIQSSVQTRLQRLEGHLKLIKGGDEIVPGIKAIGAPGHTPGHIAIEIASNGEKLLFVADIAHFSLQMEHPNWPVVFDFDAEQAIATRHRLFERAATEQTLMMGYHLSPFPSLGRVIQQKEAWTWQPIEVSGGDK